MTTQTKTETIEKLIQDVQKSQKIYVWVDLVRQGNEVCGEYFTISKKQFLDFLSYYKDDGYIPLSYHLNDEVLYFNGENK